MSNDAGTGLSEKKMKVSLNFSFGEFEEQKFNVQSMIEKPPADNKVLQ
jgi:hypothetical protein